MGSRRQTRFGSVAAAALAIGLLAGCGSDASSSTSIASAATGATDTDVAQSGVSGESVALTGEQICERLTNASVTADLGLDVTASEPDDISTPQCIYEYTNDDGVRSTLTIAGMRPAVVGGATGSDAFEYVLTVNESVAGGDVDEQEIDAGENAARLSGAALHVGIVQVGDHVYTLVVPTGDAEIDAVDRLIATMATVLA